MNKQDISVQLRDPKRVMRLKRLGSFHQSRLSFMRILTRRMAREKWTFDRPVFDVSASGVGHAVYSVHTPNRPYSLVAFAHDLPDEQRSDRVIAESWDATFTLFDGVPTQKDIKRLSKNVPLQEAGRISERELSLSRANRSVRLWDHVIKRLAKGVQPEPALIEETGYLMRTTAVYGSGKFGAADREVIADRLEMQAPFQAEMLSVYLTRTFVRDLAEHIARETGGDRAVRLAPETARALGIGNSTGLGMAPFLINHPMIINNWIKAREEAIARVRSLRSATAVEAGLFRELLSRGIQSVSLWRSQHSVQTARIADLTRDLSAVIEYLEDENLRDDFPWNRLMQWAEKSLSEEGEEYLASLILEPYGHLIDDLETALSDNDTDAFWIDGTMLVEKVRKGIQDAMEWALDVDWDAPHNCARAWYVSEEKLEPRLGERFEEPVEPYEQPLAIGRDMQLAHKDLTKWGGDAPIAEFLRLHPEHRHIIRRAQISMQAPYSEIGDNTISADMFPVDLLRSKLSYFGAIHFDPRSDRWIRIRMYSDAPYPEELNVQNADQWIYPEIKQ